VRALATSGVTALSEVESKEILRAYGLALPREATAPNAEEAAAAARAIGYPVVVKGVSGALQHKTEAGAVILNVRDEAGVLAACAQIAANMRKAGIDSPLDSFLLAEQAPEGVELVIGAHRDPECGLVFMAGAGGVLLELMKDVSFAAAPMTRAKAVDMIARTRARKLIEGFRGGSALDSEPVIAALLALGALASDVGDCIESIDINPFRVLPTGGYALDALIILRRP
jgi:succinyl-CoA synthetase beta subunit